MPNIATPVLLPNAQEILYYGDPLVVDNGDGTIYNMGGIVGSPTYDEGIQDEIVRFVKNGVSSPSGVRRTSIEPVITLPASPNPAAMALGRGKKFVTRTADTPLKIGPFLVEAETMDLGGTNVDGDGIADDLATGIGFFFSATQRETSGTRVDFSATPASAGQFAQGAGRNFKFHADDVGKQFVYFATSRGDEQIIESSETPINSVRIYFEMILSDNRILVFDAPSATPRPNGPIISDQPINLQFLFTRNPAICSIGPRIYFRGDTSLYAEFC